MRALLVILTLLIPLCARAQTGLSSVVFTNLDRSVFDIDFSRAPSNMVTLSSSRNLLRDPSQFSFPIGGYAGTVTYTNIIQTNLAAGVRDIFTVPAGVRAFQVSGLFSDATNLSPITIKGYIHDGTLYRRLGQAAQTATTNTTASASAFFSTGIYEPGDVLAVTNNENGLTMNITFKLFSTNNPVKNYRLFGLSTNPAVLYTVPSGKIAWPMISQPAGVSTIFLTNDSGSSRDVNVYLVPFGLSPDESTLISTGPVATTGLSTRNLPIMFAGTSVYVSSSATNETQSAFLTVYEQDIP